MALQVFSDRACAGDGPASRAKFIDQRAVRYGLEAVGDARHRLGELLDGVLRLCILSLRLPSGYALRAGYPGQNNKKHIGGQGKVYALVRQPYGGPHRSGLEWQRYYH